MNTIALCVAVVAGLSAPTALPCGTELAGKPTSADGKRDPFAAFEDPTIRCFTNPLQRVELGQVKLEAVVVDVASPRALVVLPDGTSHTLRIRDLIGPNYGEVIAIRRDGIEVRERFRSWNGALEVRKTLLKL